MSAIRTGKAVSDLIVYAPLLPKQRKHLFWRHLTGVNDAVKVRRLEAHAFLEPIGNPMVRVD
eukprot:6210811-Pleurochrysis_carterae.AAC.2